MPQPGRNWRVQLSDAPSSEAPALRMEPGVLKTDRVAATGNGRPRRLDWWQASQTAAGPVTTLAPRPPVSEPFWYGPSKWPGRAHMLGRQWHPGNTGNASYMSHGWPSTWYDLRLPVAYIPAARAIWRSIRTFTQATRSNDRQYIPAVFVPASPMNTLGVNHAP